MTEKYIVTIEQLAKIVDYCVHMTVAGGECRKDWTGNVREAIGLDDIITIHYDKIPLEKLETEGVTPTSEQQSDVALSGSAVEKERQREA